MNRIPSSPPSPKIETATKDQKISPEKRARVYGRFVKNITTNVAKNCLKNLKATMSDSTGISKRSIQHPTLLGKSKEEVFTRAKANELEDAGKIVKATLMRAKADEGIYEEPIEDVKRFRELGGGSHGGTELTYRGVAGPLEVKKTLYDETDSAEAEHDLLKRLDHPNIIKALPGEKGVEDHEDTYFMNDGGVALGKLVQIPEQRRLIPPEDRKLIPPQQFVSITQQMASALEYLREEQVLHRDIKPDNIVIDQGGTIKLVDFGISYDGKNQNYCKEWSYGSPPFMEPHTKELWVGPQYSDTGDMFAAGQTLFQLLTGRPILFKGFCELQGIDNFEDGSWEAYKEKLGLDKDITRKLTESLEGQPKEYIEKVTDLIRKMVEPDPSLRITPKELLQHPLLTGEKLITKESPAIEKPKRKRKRKRKRKPRPLPELPPLKGPLPPTPPQIEGNEGNKGRPLPPRPIP